MVIEVQENNSITNYCVNNDKRINMHATQALQLTPLWHSDLRILDDL